MKNKRTTFVKGQLQFISLGLLITIYSCAPMYYVPANELVTTLEKKGDMEVSAGVGTLRLGLPGTSIGGNLRVAYAPSDKIGLMGDLFYYADAFSSGSSYSETTLGIGLNHLIDSTLVFRNYFIISHGLTDTKHDFDVFGITNGFHAKSASFTLQPSITKKLNLLQVTFGLNIKHLNFFQISERRSFLEYDSYIRKNSSSTLLEPSLHLSVGKDAVKFYIQFDRSVNLSNTEFNAGRNAYASMGVKYNMNVRK